MTDCRSPFRLNLEQQRKRAKELLRALRAGEPGAAARVRRHHPGGADLDGPAQVARFARLSDAQLVIARELRLASWPKLKAHIQAMQQARDRITAGVSSLDGDARTLHIRCGADLKDPLKEAGFSGDFLEYSDALCQGPILADDSWLVHRARFLADAYGGQTGQSPEQIAERLRRAEKDLQSAAGRYERVVIWVEHDSYDQLVLARCLAQFAAAAPRRLDLISIDQFPGDARFVGLGQLPSEALRLLWAQRAAVSPRQLEAGRSIWAALRCGDPTPLAMAARNGVTGLPHLAQAVQRHCRELPWLEDGLSVTERLVLQVLAEGPSSAGEIHATLMREREPLPWLSDIMLLFILDSMRAAREPVFTSASGGPEQNWRDQRLTITDLGRSVVRADVDWLTLSPPDRWLGGVRVSATGPCWRWDEKSATTVMK